MLHIIDHFPIKHETLAKTSIGDTVIFTDNAVYAVKQDDIDQNLARKTFAHINLCVRKADLLLRNISNRELFKGVAVLDDVDYRNVLSEEPAIRSLN
ncbi:DsrH/TusB family sulfur metabolism protein [Methylomarinum sp. Ch1-1]|uniref:DsrH/TusB family sulfur metabolism protein n=1 Tax=Methylomarinum roseum TaxID=3067653 RepID=A0AAU7NXS1_9GAMM|nr:DsrH/TusB family sulfur metabolism protein [Methylomarinum sp. Ch1-1]MDP4522152.1 DsrH/TusB family sulfur metabolism protein [Methylomarinum sp. Ch1-1]